MSWLFCSSLSPASPPLTVFNLRALLDCPFVVFQFLQLPPTRSVLFSALHNLTCVVDSFSLYTFTSVSFLLRSCRWYICICFVVPVYGLYQFTELFPSARSVPVLRVFRWSLYLDIHPGIKSVLSIPVLDSSLCVGVHRNVWLFPFIWLFGWCHFNDIHFRQWLVSLSLEIVMNQT